MNGIVFATRSLSPASPQVAIRGLNMLFRLLLCITAFSSLFGESAADRLPLLRQGDLVVYGLPRSVFVIAVKKNASDSTSFHVVTATKDLLEREEFSDWIEWFDSGFPSASTNELITLYNGVRSASAHVDWFCTMLTLQLSPIPDQFRKRIGPKPMAGERDFRPIWQPKIVANGKRFDSPSIAFEAQWPTDGSPLSERHLILYFPISDKTVHALPYRIESPSSSYYAEVIDSRTSLLKQEE